MHERKGRKNHVGPGNKGVITKRNGRSIIFLNRTRLLLITHRIIEIGRKQSTYSPKPCIVLACLLNGMMNILKNTSRRGRGGPPSSGYAKSSNRDKKNAFVWWQNLYLT